MTEAINWLYHNWKKSGLKVYLLDDVEIVEKPKEPTNEAIKNRISTL
jgi:hypothetical protein